MVIDSTSQPKLTVKGLDGGPNDMNSRSPAGFEHNVTRKTAENRGVFISDKIYGRGKPPERFIMAVKPPGLISAVQIHEILHC
jgi:hypothetical protein